MGEVLPFAEMCRREGAILRRGMTFRARGRPSVFLTGARPARPYDDRFEDEGRTLLYQGHDCTAAAAAGLDPATVDQPARTAGGRPTPNGRFFEAAHAYLRGQRPPEIVRVYEKLGAGLWADRGLFDLVDAWQESDGPRRAFRFRLSATPVRPGSRVRGPSP